MLQLRQIHIRLVENRSTWKSAVLVTLLMVGSMRGVVCVEAVVVLMADQEAKAEVAFRKMEAAAASCLVVDEGGA